MLEINQYSYAYSGSDQWTLKQLDFSVEQGEFLLLCGESGSGKSTLLRNLLPALTPFGRQEGHIYFDGRELSSYTSLEIAKNIGFVGQNPSDQIVCDQVQRELAFGMENLGLPRDVMFQRMAEICEFFGISTWMGRPTETLSGGEMQLLNLASVMVMEPKVLLLDEPTSQLDPIATSDFLHILHRIHRELGTTILLAEHHLEEIFSMASRVLVLDDGGICHLGAPDVVAADMARDKEMLYLGLPAAFRIASGLYRNEADLPLPLYSHEGKRWLDAYAVRHADYREDFLQEKDAPKEDAIISVKNLAFRYPDADRRCISHLSFSVDSGDWFCILGGNGAGKTTLFRLLCKGLEPEEGSMEILGTKIKRKKPAPLGFRQMVYLPQDPKALFTEISVYDELMEALEGSSCSEEEKELRVTEMMKVYGLQDFSGRHPYDLSGGQQQLLALSKLLLLEPRILLLDEPTKGLDPKRKKELGDRLTDLRKGGMTILMVSHDIEFAAEYATRCGMLFAGELVASGDTHTFFSTHHFYTTAAHRIAMDVLPHAITVDEVIGAWED